mmetsp:Transcript_5510/g.12451  ORF Transcript_5510/g.12451 Transcript_5510/m.12451 type:complete len:308 (+) Transcript_5510:1098-2021(+)
MAGYRVYRLGDVLEDEVQVEFLLLLALTVKAVLQRDYVRMPVADQLPHDLQLPILEPLVLQYLLDGHYLPRLDDARLEDHAERSVAYDPLGAVRDRLRLGRAAGRGQRVLPAASGPAVPPAGGGGGGYGAGRVGLRRGPLVARGGGRGAVRPARRRGIGLTAAEAHDVPPPRDPRGGRPRRVLRIGRRVGEGVHPVPPAAARLRPRGGRHPAAAPRVRVRIVRHARRLLPGDDRRGRRGAGGRGYAGVHGLNLRGHRRCHLGASLNLLAWRTPFGSLLRHSAFCESWTRASGSSENARTRYYRFPAS